MTEIDKVYRKGIIVLPKTVREALGMDEGHIARAEN